MHPARRGLTGVNTPDLEKLLSAVFRGEIQVPLSVQELARFGLQHCSGELLDHLRTLDRAAVQALLVAVLAERASFREELERRG